jgi:hypothetical protein
MDNNHLRPTRWTEINGCKLKGSCRCKLTDSKLARSQVSRPDGPSHPIVRTSQFQLKINVQIKTETQTEDDPEQVPLNAKGRSRQSPNDRPNMLLKVWLTLTIHLPSPLYQLDLFLANTLVSLRPSLLRTKVDYSRKRDPMEVRDSLMSALSSSEDWSKG